MYRNSVSMKSGVAQFDFTDSPILLTVACRLGSVGIIAALQDGGAQRTLFRRYMARFQRIRLHPLQFKELTAKVFYKAGLLNRTPTYVTVESKAKLLVHQLPLQGFSTKPIFDDWSPYNYANVLALKTGYPLDQIFAPPDKVWTWLQDSSGKVLTMDVKKHKWEVRDRLGIQAALAKRVRRPFG